MAVEGEAVVEEEVLVELADVYEVFLLVLLAFVSWHLMKQLFNLFNYQVSKIVLERGLSSALTMTIKRRTHLLQNRLLCS